MQSVYKLVSEIKVEREELKKWLLVASDDGFSS